MGRTKHGLPEDPLAASLALSTVLRIVLAEISAIRQSAGEDGAAWLAERRRDAIDNLAHAEVLAGFDEEEGRLLKDASMKWLRFLFDSVTPPRGTKL